MPKFKPVQNKTLPEGVAEQIMAMIADGELRPGDRLPTEPELMLQFNVGRSTLREAIKSLVMAGLLETRRSAGTFVSETYTNFLSSRLNWAVVFSEQELKHIIEVRYALEAQTAALAAERATPDQKEKLAQLVEAMGDTSLGPDKAAEIDTAFHVTIAEASHNPLLLNLTLSLRKFIHGYIEWGYAKRGYSEQVDPTENVAEHQPIVAAIQAGRSEEAREAMLNHLDTSTRWMLALAKEKDNVK